MTIPLVLYPKAAAQPDNPKPNLQLTSAAIQATSESKPQPVFPDMAGNYQSYQTAKTSCEAQGGTFSITGCDIPPPPPEPVYVAPVQPSGGCGDNFYANFIYMHEGGCNTAAINASSGACGLGQALPCSKLGCMLGDYACQNAFFTNYAISRYGSWQAAYYFWLSHAWW